MLIPKNKLEFIKKKIKEKCPCSGAGCGKCHGKVSRVSAYATAGIPVDYWMLAFKDFQGDKNFGNFVVDQIRDIEGVYERGESFAFVGNLGTGKTYAASCMLKKALVSGFSGHYYNMDEVIRLSISNDHKNFFEEITNIDFICIDEYDSRWVFPSERSETLFGQTMESILRHRFQNGMPTIICSNTPDITKVLSGDFSRTTESLFSKYMKVLYVAGKDFRKIQK